MEGRRSVVESDTYWWIRKGWCSKLRFIVQRFPIRTGLSWFWRPHVIAFHASHLWVDVGYRGRGKEWVEKELGLSVEVVHHTPKPTPEKVARIWAEEWSKEGGLADRLAEAASAAGL
jgi:hypothetical protein